MKNDYLFAIGQDSHRFLDYTENQTHDERIASCPERPQEERICKGQMLGGFWIAESPTLSARSDGDVILHALTNAISGITGVNILGEKADHMCLAERITDSTEYVREALKYLADREIVHVSFSVECKTPRLSPHIDDIRRSISDLLKIPKTAVGMTATSGEELSSFGRGEGIMVFCAITVRGAQTET